VKAFKAPQKMLGNLGAEVIAKLIVAAADVALILDTDGVICDLAFQSEELSQELDGGGKWLGRKWSDIVTIDSRAKITALLRDVDATAPTRWRHLNHTSAGGDTVPVLYTAVKFDDEGHVVAFGRDLRSISALQQRLVDAQQSMERDYARLRHVEMRYRLLFEMSAEPVLIVDAFSQKIAEANPAARQLFGEAARRLVGRVFPEAFDPAGARAVRELLGGVRASGRGDNVRARLAGEERDVLISASLFRQESAALFLVRLSAAAETVVAVMSKEKTTLLKAVENIPDGFVVTGPDGRLLSANAAFLDMAQLATEEQARGESLERWLGRPGVEMDVLMANLRQRGSVRLFATTLRGEYGAAADVEVSAVAVMNGGTTVFGLAIRNVDRRMSEPRNSRELPRSVEQLTELVGRVSLKDLVRETTDVIERLCIEAALELTNDNRASAAEMLGLSRQSLYSKLRRYGLGELDPDPGNEG
jgi:transcriptional regulator PpsR